MSSSRDIALPVTLTDVRTASDRLNGRVHRTPVQTSQTLDRCCRASVFLKCENFQRGGAFKLRGSYNRLLKLSSEQRKGGVVARSSGNHAQGVAIAAAELGIESIIVMPETSPLVKQEASTAYGANLLLAKGTSLDREVLAKRMAEERGAIYIPGYDDWDIICGQGTAALELFEDFGSFDVLLTPVGGGGLLAGTAIVAKALNEKVKVIGVEPEGADDARQSLKTGELVPQLNPSTIADGLRSSFGERPFQVARQLVDGIITVDDCQIIAAMRFVYERLKLVIEPSSALPIAALLNRKIACDQKRVGVIISGGNADLSELFGSLSPLDR